MDSRIAALALLAASCVSAAPPDPNERLASAADGVPIAYEVHGAGEPALVFVHGLSCDREFWRAQLYEFARDHTVVALDLPGHGHSGSRRARWTVAGLGDDVRALVLQLGLERVVLIGHSMGGPVCLEAAARMPERVLGVIGVDTLHDAELEVPADALEAFAQRFEKDFDGAQESLVRASFPSSSDPALVRWTLERMRRANPATAIALMRDFENVDLKALLSAVHVPVRCVNAAPEGELALPTSIETNRKYADFDAVTLGGVGHFLMLEKPVEFDTKLRAFVDEIAARAPAAAAAEK